MPVHVDGLQLFTGDESNSVTEGNVDVTSAPTFSPDEAILTTLQASESMTISGLATGIRISGESGYSSDPETALSEWVQEFISLVSTAQGDGWDVTDDERNRSIQVIATGANWTHAGGAPLEARWTLEITRGEGVLDTGTRSPTTDTPNASETLGGTDLGSVNEKRTELAMSVETTPIAFASPAETVITPGSGVTRRITITGRKAGTQAELRTFDTTMRGNVGNNQSFTYQTGFPGTTHTVAVGNYDSTYNAGATGSIDYALSLREGEVL